MVGPQERAIDEVQIKCLITNARESNRLKRLIVNQMDLDPIDGDQQTMALMNNS